jgi:hypothetical protein
VPRRMERKRAAIAALRQSTSSHRRELGSAWAHPNCPFPRASANSLVPAHWWRARMRRARLIGYPPTHAARPRAIFQEVRYASLAVIPLYAYAVVGSASEALSAALDPGAGRFAITIKNDPHIIQ